MKILLVSSSSGSRGGGEKFLLQLGRGLQQTGHEVLVWASNHARMDELCAEFAAIGAVHRAPYCNTYDHRTRTLATLCNPGTVRRIAAEWSELKVDLIHLNKQNLEDGLDLMRAADQLSIPSLCTVHLTQTARELGARWGLLRDVTSRMVLLHYRGPLVAVEESRCRALNDFLGGGAAVHTIENGVAPFDDSSRAALGTALRAELGWSAEEYVFCSVGRMVAQKRPLLFVDVALKWLAKNPQARFLWIGDGPLAGAWDERVAAAGAGKQIRRLPWQASSTPGLAAANVYVHTAAYEGLPFALLEAMSARLPCLVVDDLAAAMPGLRKGEVIPFRGDCGFSTSDLEPKRLQAAAAMGHAAVEERFSQSQMTKRYEDLYRQLTRAPRL